MYKKTLYKAFGLKLRNARKKAGLTQDDLAHRVSLTRTSITNIEKGRQGVPLHLLLDLSSAVGVQPKDLLPEFVKDPTQHLVDRKKLERKLSEEEGVGWVERIISSGLKREEENELNREKSK